MGDLNVGVCFERTSQTHLLASASLVPHGFDSEIYLKCDWCGARASFWIRQKNYCGDCVAVRLPENKPEKDWWPAVQQVAVPVAVAG
jgi:hypothetical protein